ncbi:hypothetical protein [Hyalangium sp.]|uniref:hypothetical protein n=1 Tax=Hyalangium sp. TaxID=2028555 RepID=UPI002D2CD0D6|nr:hypothetical protein [Hyalangium sp.]HYI03209.1 hypothetical protein [Hyalangium sp.]
MESDVSNREFAVESHTSISETALAQAWTEISPGVWERSKPEGGYERMGYGAEGFEFALQNARMERTFLETMRVEQYGSRAAEKRLAANEKLIRYLEDSVSQARASGVHEPLPVSAPEWSTLGSSGTPSGVFCAGSYDFTITFDYGMVDGSVTTLARWSEFGPFSEFTRNIQTYAYAWTEDHGAYQVDSDGSGPIGGTCCYNQESFAAVGVTFSPMLYGSAYIMGNGASGCMGMRFYESSNY